MSEKTYRSANIGVQPGEPTYDGHEAVTETTNSGSPTDVKAWAERQAKLKTAADEATLRAYPTRIP